MPGDYISREAARTSIMSKYDEVLSVADALECIDSLPAADMREVVLCKDCTFFKAPQKSARQYIAEYDKWLANEPNPIRLIAWRRWKKQRPVWEDKV